MKTPVAITLIIMGALLVMTPSLADMVYQHNVVTVITKAGVTSVSLAGQMSELYRFGCWATGSGMVLIAVLSALRAGSRQGTSSVPGDLTAAHQR
jgi:hypothetical protein